MKYPINIDRDFNYVKLVSIIFLPLYHVCISRLLVINVSILKRMHQTPDRPLDYTPDQLALVVFLFF